MIERVSRKYNGSPLPILLDSAMLRLPAFSKERILLKPVQQFESFYARRRSDDPGAIFSAVLPFVMARRKSSGGYGATPRLPATIEDTYHALHVLDLARKYGASTGDDTDPARDENLHVYLTGVRRRLPVGSRSCFQLFWCLRAAGLELDPDDAEATFIAGMKAADNLDDWYYGARIFAEVLNRPWRQIAGEGRLNEILDGGWRTVSEAWMHIQLSLSFRQSLPWPRHELVSWFQSSQNNDGGFGFFPGTTSFAENCHAALRALAFFESEPLDPAGAFSFLAGCQTANGGFGRNFKTAAFLDITWHALAALALLPMGATVLPALRE